MSFRELPIITVNAFVLVFKQTQQTWTPSGEVQALSCVQILKRENSEVYRIVAWRQPDNTVVLNSFIKAGLKYKSYGQFQQWRDVTDSQVYGLHFSDIKDSDAFNKAIIQIIDTLKQFLVPENNVCNDLKEELCTGSNGNLRSSVYSSTLVANNHQGPLNSNGQVCQYSSPTQNVAHLDQNNHRRQMSSISGLQNTSNYHYGSGSLNSYASSSGVSSASNPATAASTAPPSMHYAPTETLTHNGHHPLNNNDEYDIIGQMIPSNGHGNKIHSNGGMMDDNVDETGSDEMALPKNQLNRLSAMRPKNGHPEAPPIPAPLNMTHQSPSKPTLGPPAPPPPPPPPPPPSSSNNYQLNKQKLTTTNGPPAPPPPPPPPGNNGGGLGSALNQAKLSLNRANSVDVSKSKPIASNPADAMMAEMQRKILARRIALDKAESEDDPASSSSNTKADQFNGDGLTKQKPQTPHLNLKGAIQNKNLKDVKGLVTQDDLDTLQRDLTSFFMSELSKAKNEIIEALQM